MNKRHIDNKEHSYNDTKDEMTLNIQKTTRDNTFRHMLLGMFIAFLGMHFSKLWSPDYDQMINSEYGFLLTGLVFLLLIPGTWIIELLVDDYLKNKRTTK
ncbi:hypothetical protein LCGC14_0936980 [marine sediment metagenome]|uniref:Uncharacterized protein n=1 Tax=marine sediment metagenome TaxID=412755 RepID=A0A0F9R4U0_9ZZZZ